MAGDALANCSQGAAVDFAPDPATTADLEDSPAASCPLQGGVC